MVRLLMFYSGILPSLWICFVTRLQELKQGNRKQEEGGNGKGQGEECLKNKQNYLKAATIKADRRRLDGEEEEEKEERGGEKFRG